jgi:hypothetical protein
MRISNLFGAGALAAAALIAPAAAQPMPTDNDVVVNLTPADIQNLQAKSQTNERSVLNGELGLTPAEAQAFWPVYNAYADERAPIYARRQALINQFVAISASIGDAQASMFANQWTQLDADQVNLRLKYLPRFDAVLPGIKLASFLQIDRRIAMMNAMALSNQLPILTTQVGNPS